MTEQSHESPTQDVFEDLLAPDPNQTADFALPGQTVSQEDYSGDGITDVVIQRLTDGTLVAVSDANGDLIADHVGVAMHGDSDFDLVVSRQEGNYHIQFDSDGDGVLDSELNVTREELFEADAQMVALLDVRFGGEPASADLPPQQQELPGVDSTLVVDGELVGDPAGDSEHWFEQAANGFCVPASIAQIASEYSGTHFASEADFVERANELKVFEVGPDGVPSIGLEGALTLLEDAGVPATIEIGQGMDTLADYLEEGRRVMVAVDSGEIWYGEQQEDQAADHAIVVTGVDLERGVVIVSDPGDPEGNAKEYPISQFEDAWADSGYAALVCDVPPDGLPDLAGPPDSPFTPGRDEPSTAESAVKWTISHAWVVLPVLLGARAIAGARK